MTETCHKSNYASSTRIGIDLILSALDENFQPKGNYMEMCFIDLKFEEKNMLLYVQLAPVPCG